MMNFDCPSSRGFLRELGLSVQMKLYNMSKREFVMVFIAFFAALCLSIVIGLAGPPITVTVQQRALQIDPKITPKYLATGPFVMKTPSLSSYSQQLWVIGRYEMEHKEFFQKDFYLTVSLQGLTKGNSEEVLRKKKHRFRNETLSCTQDICDEFGILHLGFIEHTRYILNVSVSGLEGIQNWSPLHDFIFYFKTYDPAFTKLEIWCRIFFVFISFIITTWFAHSLRKYAVLDWSLEQKWLSFLLPMLLLYNDPLFPLMFLVDSWIPSFVDTLFQSTFLFALLLFWLCIYHGLRQNHRNFYPFYMPKIVIVGFMWFCSVIVATAQKVSELGDPLYSAALHTNHFHTFKILFFITVAIYSLYLVYFIITAYSELRSMPFFDVRLKFLTILMVVAVSVILAVTATKFGVGPLEDNFVADLSTAYSSSASFTAFYGLINLYVFTCAYVYSPSDKGTEAHLLKDNPALSMVNDSDEDVIYGSDEDTRRPLNRGNGNEESD